jgi:NADPH:quinone reductase-like Zn-dependent oxidoreductase
VLLSLISDLLADGLGTAVRGGKGPADALYIEEGPTPKVGKDESLVKIKAFGLNRMDLMEREGKYPLPPQAPGIMGVEFSGIIESIGPDPSCDFHVGDEVFGLTYGGQSKDHLQAGMCIRRINESQVATRNTSTYLTK